MARLRKREEVGPPMDGSDHRAGLALACAGIAMVVGFATEYEVLATVCGMALLVGIPWVLGRPTERRERRREARKAALREPPPPQSAWRKGLRLFFAGALVVCAIAVVFSNNAITPLHVMVPGEGRGPDLPPILLLYGIAGGVALFLVAWLVAWVHERAAAVVLWLAGMVFAGGLYTFGIGLFLDGLNVHYDSSAPRRVSARLLRIEPPASYARHARSTLVLADWRQGTAAEVRVPYRTEAFRLDVDKRYVDFYWREGLLGRPYVIAYPERP